MKNTLYLCSMKWSAAVKFNKMIVLAALLLPGWLSAQEKIIEVQNQQDSYSIVRETRGGQWLVYNYNYGQCRFSLVDELQTYTPQLILGYIEGTDSMSISDFEIFRDTVFFCGRTWRGKASSAIWGYFPLAGFPIVTVHYDEVDAVGFKKIDVFSIDTTTLDLHVVMIKKDNNLVFQTDYIYDVVRTAPDVFTYYSARIVDGPLNSIIFDVAETDNYVALSSHVFQLGIMFFDKPTTLFTTFLVSPYGSYELPSNGPTGSILEYCKNDAIVATYKDLFGGIRVQSFIGCNPYAAIEINDCETLTPIDMKFDKVSEDLDILVTEQNVIVRSDSSMILHLNPSLAYNGGPVFCHKYVFEKLNSLDRLSTKKNCFVASGHDEGQSHLRLYKYYFNNWGACAQQEIIESVKLETPKEPEEPQLRYESVSREMQVLRSYYMELPLKIKCE